MTSSWTSFLHTSIAADHAVQVYVEVDELAESVGAYLAAGFDLGEPAVVVATPEHWRLFGERLEACGWGPDEIDAQGLLINKDADATLALILEDGRPSGENFERVVGGVIDELSARFPGRHVRAFGEMVDLLCERGDSRSAAELEELWNRLAERRRFSLLCGYRLDLFDTASQKTLLPQVCRAHSHVQPAADVERLGEAVDAALAEVLGSDAGKVYAQMTDRVGRNKWLPASERALMWVSANMPAHADRILASARAHYAAAAG